MESKYELIWEKSHKDHFKSSRNENFNSIVRIHCYSPWPSWSCPSCSPPPIHPSRSFDLRCSPPPRWGSSKVPKESRGSALAAVGRDAEVPLAEVFCSGSLLERSLSMLKEIKLYWRGGLLLQIFLQKSRWVGYRWSFVIILYLKISERLFEVM